MLSRNSLVKFTKPLALILALISMNTFFVNAANSATGYRYWGYVQAAPGATQWTAAMTGPSVEVKDGAVEGWTFVFSSNDVPAATPMMDPDFASLCGETPEAAGKVRVGLVVDFGAANIAPAGETPKEFFSDCVVVDEGSVGLDVLQSALEVRAGESGLICGIGGYPATECGAEVEAPATEEAVTTSAPVETESSSSNSPILLGALAVLLIAGFVVARRRNKQ